MNKTKIAVIVVAVLVVGLILGLIAAKTGSQHELGASSYDRLDQVGEFTQGLTRGVTMRKGFLRVGTSTSATPVSLYESGTCTLLGNVTILATTTLNVDCAITDVRPGDLVRLTLPASSTMSAQFVPTAFQASSTSGYATVSLLNLTGANRAPSAVPTFGSSTMYQIWRSVSSSAF